MQKEASSQTRDRILEASLKLFSRKGFLGATTKEIAKAAGIAEITLFRHFPSKENLFEEVLNSYTFLPVLKGLLPEISPMPYEEALTIIARRFLDTLESRKEMIQIMNSEVKRYPEKIHKIYHGFIEELIRTLASYFAELQKQGVLREFDAETAARAFLGMFFSMFNAREFHKLKKYRNVDVGSIVGEFVNIFAKGTLR
ncbi:MAG TPA: TetR/AcrR family transcriptional regulator [Thermodesulfovibrionales bacterium]|nr:TetR/AcrR family transcriptional regulator [Thermodesulfovibrionales bacterium]